MRPNGPALQVTHDAVAHRFTTELAGYAAHLEYELAGQVMVITHTYVPGPIGGRGVAGELMRNALSVAAASGWSVDPVCRYAAAYVRRHR